MSYLYPFVPTTWNDGSGIFSRHWTLSTSWYAILNAALGVLISFAVSRLLYIVNTIIFYQRHEHTRSVLDDQIHTIATNTSSAAGFIFSLSVVIYTYSLRVLRSVAFWLFTCSAISLLAVQVLATFGVKFLASDGPVPILEGPCGFPIVNPNGTALAQNLSSFFSIPLAQVLSDSSTTVAHALPLYERAANRFVDCVDGGTSITCPGPVDGQTFTWEVFESESSYCWFGSEHCYNSPDARTILQRATITPASLGTTRQSRLAITYISECSNVDSSNLTTTGSLDGLSYHLFNYGPYNWAAYPQFRSFSQSSIFEPFINATFIIYDDEQLSKTYWTNEAMYPLIGTNFTFTNDTLWMPAEFLRSNLNSSSFVDPKNGTQTLTVVVNRLSGVDASFSNGDPFYLTDSVPFMATTPVYESGEILATLACRDQIQVHVRPNTTNPPQYTSDDVVAIGRIDEVVRQLIAEGASLPNKNLAADLETDFIIFNPTFLPLIFQAVNGLAGNVLNGASTVIDGLQQGNPANLTTRAEVTRWFGTVILYILYSAQMYTSGTDNDWGYGVQPFPPSPNEPQHWVCSSTLRTSSKYTSINLNALIVMLSICAFVICLSYALEPLLGLISWSRKMTPSRAWKAAIREAVVAHDLHHVLQLHRIAFEKTYSVKFTNTRGLVPKVVEKHGDIDFRYGVIELVPERGVVVEPMPVVGAAPNVAQSQDIEMRAIQRERTSSVVSEGDMTAGGENGEQAGTEQRQAGQGTPNGDQGEGEGDALQGEHAIADRQRPDSPDLHATLLGDEEDIAEFCSLGDIQ
jgi:hypothetical protein